MRLIGTIASSSDALVFSQFLKEKGITHYLDFLSNRDWGSANYGLNEAKIWIEEEDMVPQAQEYYQLFIQNPSNPFFKVNLPTTVPPPLAEKDTEQNAFSQAPQTQAKAPLMTLWEKQPMGRMTKFFLFLCCALFIVGEVIPSSKKGPDGKEIITFFSSPMSQGMLYDFPRFYALLDKFLVEYGLQGVEQPQKLSIEGKTAFKQLMQTPYWKGFYDEALEKGFDKLLDWKNYPPLFEKIREGQLWRLFSPALLHANIFHLFFNMLWLIVLGKQIDQRLTPLAYLSLILILGIFSNTIQYLMGGPNFLGFSGVLCGMLTFIWMRQRYTPWEGYLLDRSTFLYMAIFVLGMASLQLFSFAIEKSFQISSIAPSIANTAHLSGAVAGFALGRLRFFSWRRTS